MAPSKRTRGAKPSASIPDPSAGTAGASPSKKVKTEGAWVDVVKVEGQQNEVEKKTFASTPPKIDTGGVGKSKRASFASPPSTSIVPAVGGGAVAVAASPYPEMKRPTVEECWFARDALAQLHSTFFDTIESQHHGGGNALGPGSVTPALLAPAPVPADAVITSTAIVPVVPGLTVLEQPAARKCVLDSLVGTILSQNTTDSNSHRAFGILKARFPTWESVRVAKPKLVEDAIKSGGLAEIKVTRIQVILNTLVEERGQACMEYLRGMDDEAAKKELSRFKGVGPKTVSCVLMFCLQRAEFPVDTHVWKIAAGLGWVPKSATRDTAGAGCSSAFSVLHSNSAHLPYHPHSRHTRHAHGPDPG